MTPFMIRWIMLSLVLTLASGATTLAQTHASTGQIVGTVVDQNGAAIAGASVLITSPTTGLERALRTNDAGQYRIVLLPAGRYNVTIEATGFQKAARIGIEVNVGRAVDAHFTLRVGAIAETVEVAATVGVETTRPESGAIINAAAIRDLPINGRRFQDFVTLTPMVQIEPQRGQFSFAGQRGINSNISIDGADYNEPFFGGIRGGERSNSYFTIPQESIAEFQVVATGYSSEFGRSTGGVVNVITKSGSNQYHGSAFYLLRHKELTAKDAFDQLSLGTQHQAGGSIGGPLVRDRLFFFSAVERQDFTTPRHVFFPRLQGLARAPENQEAFDFYRSLEGPFDQTNDATAFIIRTDYQLSAKHRLAVRYNFSDNHAANANASGEALNPLTNRALSNNGTEEDRIHTVVGQFNSVLSPNVVHEARFQYSREARPRPANALSPNVDTVIGNFGTRDFLPIMFTDWRFQAADAMTWNIGHHSAKFGFDWNRTAMRQLFGRNQTGKFNVRGSSDEAILRVLSRTPGAAGDHRFDDPAVTYTRQIGNLLFDAQSDEIAVFGQDSWRVRNNVTLYYGLRYEAQFHPEPATNNTALFDLVRNFSFPLGRVDPSIIPDNADQFMPRLGLAWDPFRRGRTVVRGGVGLYYARTPLLVMADALNGFRLPPGNLSIQLPLAVPPGDPNNTIYRQLLAIGIDLDRFSLDNLPIISPADVQRVSDVLGLSAPDPFAGVNVTTWADHYRNPRAMQWSLGLEHELAHGFTLGAAFNYVNTVNLQRSRDYNLPVPLFRADDLSRRPFFGLTSRAQTRPIPMLGTVLVRESSARSLYRGLTVRAEFRRARVQFQTYYTLSWSDSDDDNERSSFGQEETVNAYDLKPEYSFSRLDARHLFSFHTVVSLPLGLETSSVIRLRSARPLNPLTGADTNEDLFDTDRPLEAPGSIFKRNAFRNRAYSQIDLRLLKGFNLWNETAKLQLSFEFFNLFNFDNVEFSTGRGSNSVYGLGIDPATGQSVAIDSRFRRLRLDDGSFDKNNIPGTPFQMQVGVRLIF